MDLCELQELQGVRHPWERARVDAVRKVLAPHLHEGIRILDMGCGDGFVIRTLSGNLREKKLTGVDINLTDEMLQELQGLPGGIRYLNRTPQERFDLLLLMDVIEHVPDDYGFLGGLVAEHLAPGGKILLTVPTFQFLFGHHDVVLGHYRRYRLSGLEAVAQASQLRVVCSGYLFGSLLLPKIIYNRLCQAGGAQVGVGGWQHGAAVTALIEAALKLDNSLLLTAARYGVKIPGLSAWALCEKI